MKSVLGTHRKLREGLRWDGGQSVAGAHLQFGILLVLQGAVQWSAQDFRPKGHHLGDDRSRRKYLGRNLALYDRSTMNKMA